MLMKKRIEKLEQRLKTGTNDTNGVEYEFDLSGFTVEELRYLEQVIENGEDPTTEMAAKLLSVRSIKTR